MSQVLRHTGRQNAHRVIVFVSLALCALAACLVYLGGVGLRERACYYADFSYAAGLQTGSPVKVSGIRIGHIARLALLTAQAQPPAALPCANAGQKAPPVVRATLRLDYAAAPYVTSSSRWSVVTTGIIGDAYLELSPGVGHPCPEGTTVRGVDAPHLHRMALATETVLQHLVPLFSVDEASEATADAGPAAGLVQAITHLLVSHQDLWTALVRDGAEAVGDARAVAAAIRGVLGDGKMLSQTLQNLQSISHAVANDYPALRAQTQEAIGDIQVLTRRLDAQLSTEQVQEWSAHVTEILTHTAAASHDAQIVAQALAEGDGTLASALRDPVLYNDLQALVHELRAHPYKLIWRK